MKNILIGSRALAYWNSELKLKDSTDWDVISDTPIPGTEWHDPDFLNNCDMEILASDNFIKYPGHKLYVMSMPGLAIIKRSHLWRNYKFQSHITQYHKYGLAESFNYSSDYKFPYDPFDSYSYYEERLELTHEAFPHNHPKLNKSKDEFFDDAVTTRKYDHDLLHELVAYYDEPLYKQLLTSDDSVWCDKESWDKLPHLRQLLCVSEEVMVTALERFIIPNHKYPYKHAYIMSLDKVCTTMCSGWFRDFAIDNYPAIIDLFNKQRMVNAMKQLGEI